MLAMVIDDSRVTRLILGQILKTLGFEVAEANDGAEGLRKLKETVNLQLALVDCNMPEMDGADLVRAVRADPAFKNLRVLMVTGEQNSAHIAQCLDAGADGCLQKPFTREQVQERLNSLGILLS